MKDAKGHGSNSRATATAAGYSVVHRPPLGHFVQGPSGEHGPYFMARGAWQDAARLATTFVGKGQDRSAAKALASGPKSDATPVHDAMSHGGSLHNALTQLANDAVNIPVPAPTWGLKQR